MKFLVLIYNDHAMLDAVPVPEFNATMRERFSHADELKAKEMLGGFNLIEAENMDEALKIADMFPWASTGCIEVRRVRDVAIVRDRIALRD